MEFAERLLEQEGVAIVPGEAFGTEQHIRISYAASMEDLSRGLDRLQRFVESQ
jgi:aspartate aminotransferase